jgi:hypothetical protein
MPVHLPEPHWPAELLERGPDEDPSILLSGVAEIGTVPHRILAVRVNPSHAQVDYRADLDEAVYADYQLEVMLDELNVFDNVDRSVMVPLESGNYVIWMVPSADH